VPCVLPLNLSEKYLSPVSLLDKSQWYILCQWFRNGHNNTIRHNECKEMLLGFQKSVFLLGDMEV
jgi:hypothetical protein